MATTQDIITYISDLKIYLEEIDQGIEALHETVAQFQAEGITPDKAQFILDALAQLRLAADKIPTHDVEQEEEPQPEEAPSEQ